MLYMYRLQQRNRCKDSSFDLPVKTAEPDSFILALFFHTSFGTLYGLTCYCAARTSVTKAQTNQQLLQPMLIRNA